MNSFFTGWTSIYNIIRETHAILVDFWLMGPPEILGQQCGGGVNEQVYVGLAFHVDFSYILANISCCLSVAYSEAPFWRMYFRFSPTHQRSLEPLIGPTTDLKIILAIISDNAARRWLCHVVNTLNGNDFIRTMVFLHWKQRDSAWQYF